MRFSSKLLKPALTAALVASFMVAGSVPAQAAYTSLPTSTVNCTGTRTTYTTVRYTGSAPVEIYVTNAAGSGWGGWRMTLGSYIVATGARHSDIAAYGASSWATIVPSGLYVRDTRYRISAAMEPSSGTCDNTWAGTLYW